jgi:uncharacterized protein YebE (UPF0316 family)
MDILLDQPALLGIAIFLARVLDVSLGTLRTIFVFRSYAALAALIGFVETLVWVLAASQVLQNLQDWYLAVAYAAGFATGNWVGMWLEAKLAVGSELVRAVSPNREVPLAASLREADYSVTELDGHGDDGKPVEVLLIVEKRRRLPQLLRLIDRVDPEAVYTVSDIKRSRHTAPQRRPAGMMAPESIRK